MYIKWAYSQIDEKSNDATEIEQLTKKVSLPRINFVQQLEQ
jgi:hypothetical protein